MVNMKLCVDGNLKCCLQLTDFSLWQRFCNSAETRGKAVKKLNVCVRVRVFQTTLLFTYLTDLAPLTSGVYTNIWDKNMLMNTVNSISGRYNGGNSLNPSAVITIVLQPQGKLTQKCNSVIFSLPCWWKSGQVSESTNISGASQWNCVAAFS